MGRSKGLLKKSKFVKKLSKKVLPVVPEKAGKKVSVAKSVAKGSLDMRVFHTWNDGCRSQSPYKPGESILLLGEGNFSFAKGLALRLLEQTGLLRLDKETIFYATCFDSEEILLEKYGEEAKSNIQYLLDVGVKVLFSIDATKLGHYKKLKNITFHRIVFHFPHTGMGTKDRTTNIRENQRLVKMFLDSASSLLVSGKTEYKTSMIPHKIAQGNIFAYKAKPQRQDAEDEEENVKTDQINSEIHVTLKWKDPYLDWNIRKLSSKVECRESFRFHPDIYPGYEHRRTLGFKEGKSLGLNDEILSCECKTFVFQLPKQQ